MKKILTVIFLVAVLTSCNDDFLDQVPDDRLTFEETFSKRNTVEQYLANIYSRIPNEMAQMYSPQQNGGVWLGASDEAEFVWSWSRSNNFNIGDWDGTTDIVNVLWNNYYNGIRAASTFIANVNSCKDCTDARKAQYAAEARTLRAYYYYMLMRNWGPVVLLGDAPVSPDADLSGLQRNTVQECTNFIVSELDIAAEALRGVSFTGDNAGRMSRPFALAIKEKALLLAASPLLNGNTDYSAMEDFSGNKLINQNADAARWGAAASAAKAFIDEFVPGTYDLYRKNDANGNYSPYLSCRDVMVDDWNREIIYARTRGWLLHQYNVTPLHAGYAQEVRGSGGLSATQEMVDAYFTANGRSIDDSQSGYQQGGFSDFQAPFDIQNRSTYNQWVNREPRFYVGITYNNSLWLNRNFGDIITTTWYWGNSGRGAGGNDYPVTGYIVRKNMITGNVGNTNRSEVMLRLAEIYLDYAEALNEFNPGDPDVLVYLNKIRNRAGIPEYGSAGLEIPAGQAQMREAIHKERRVELAFENVRYFDVRRWKEAPQLFSGPMHGLDINAGEEANFYNVVTFENRVFNLRHNLWPVPQNDLNVNPSLVQNTGW